MSEPRNETTRPVWVDPVHLDRLFKIVRDLENYGGLLGNTDADLIRTIAYSLRDAPADAVEAVKRTTPTKVDPLAVLTALGYPGCPSQETPT